MSSTYNTHTLQQFKSQVAVKFQLYNSLFTSLPFHTIERTGILTSLLLLNCEEGYKKGKSPEDIINDFFARQTNFSKDEEKLDLLFKFVQYIERQVVLFDALEDAAFKQINDLEGKGSLKHLAIQASTLNNQEAIQKTLDEFKLQLVLTAHPTQFYRGTVLGIIHDLSSAINSNNEQQIYTYLQQLGRTPFFQQEKPTPYDEAVSLIWYLENVFYPAIGRITTALQSKFLSNHENPVIQMGFWPGGDRDGNPFVNAETTMQVANALRGGILKCYYSDVRKLRRRLTFKGVDIIINQLEKRLYDNLFIPGYLCDVSAHEIISSLQNISHQLKYYHGSLFVEQVENLINKIKVFGLHFASLDIRQDSSIHGKTLQSIAIASELLPANYGGLTEEEKIEALVNISTSEPITNALDNHVEKDVLEVMATIQQIQQNNGEAGCNRYIISQCNSALNVFEVMALFALSGWDKENINVDIIPLFETIDDLQHAQSTMEYLYNHPSYKKHLAKRGNRQIIMLGFSDGTKDGGYLMANWSIYKAKEELTTISNQYNVQVAFFDGRGGPPARGGGKTNNFYASLGNGIANKEIQLTIQGQTISSNFGTIDAAQYNIEQLLHAGLWNNLSNSSTEGLSKEQQLLITRLSEYGHIAYKSLKQHPVFTDYLFNTSPLRFYAETNIGSRPAKRGSTNKLEFKDLRAIPFVGAWSQLKQNVTGYYGVGFALEKLSNEGKWNEAKQLYQNSLFFRTLIDNCEMAMKKSFFPLTAYLGKHDKYGEIWTMIFEEYERTKKYVLLLSGRQDLMDNYPVDQLSIQMRERIVLPLLTIQQYALAKIRAYDDALIQPAIKQTLEKLIMRCSFGIINAGRNSA